MMIICFGKSILIGLKRRTKLNYKKAREKKGFSQAYVASKVGLSIPGYRNIEDGVTKNPREETLKKIEKLLK
jgi:transcriptional regulator with XRE-family HTH domain